ncbi:hypothetical protein [uncultured Alistipes sp.]|uniref:hypothetical protein n=1 Tax=uncultured Alistipes sp. TaxID=538949 RepID=UPI00272C18AD|nr:hypothetical protein [uncultured Alistipes sp.]
MAVRRYILLLLLGAVSVVCRVTAARPDTWAAERFPEDSLSRMAEERNRRLYDSLQSKAGRHALPRMLYRLISARPRVDTLENDRVLDESRALARYKGKIIGDIIIERRQVFRPDGNWLQRTGNKVHLLTRERVIRRDLLFRSGDPFDPGLVVRNMQLLRSRRYISNVGLTVRPDTLDTTRVDLVIRTRDSWTVSVDVGFHSEGRTMAGLSDANVLGTGNMLAVKTNFSRKDFSYGGNLIEYGIPNVLGTFFTADFAAGRDFYKSTLDMKLCREFLRPTDYEAGASYSDLKFKQYMIEQDTSLLVKVRNFNVWGGYSRFLAPIRSSAFLTAHYNRRRFVRRPDGVSATHHPALHGRDVMLFGAGLYREKFFTANMIYGFGTREYLAAGYKAEFVSGYSWGEFDEGLYFGAGLKAGGFCSLGYIMGGFSLGSSIDRASGRWSRSAVDVDLRWFSPLFIMGRSRVRQFLMLNYTQGWNRDTGNDESIRFTRRNGLQALKEHAIGTNRTVLNTETVFFTPWQPLGFRIAFFGFADFGLIGRSPNTFRNDFFASLGGGIRIRNEHLIFSTLQIRLGLAFGKGGLVDSEYFRFSSYTRLEQYRYRPQRPEMVAFE